MKRLFERVTAIIARIRDPSAHATAQAKALVPAQEIQNAIGHHQAGRLQEAEAIYRRVLAAEPSHFDALHLLGVISLQHGDSAQAVDLISRAIAIEPSNHSAHANLGMAYQALNRLEDAERALQNALALKPDWAATHNNLGVLFQRQGELDKAEGCFSEALALNPNDADALNNLGGTHKDRGNLERAEECYRRALALKPNLVETWVNLGSVLQRRGSLEEAESCYREALALKANDAAACNGLGSVFQQQGNLPEAESWFRKALDADPESTEAACNLGDILQALGRLDEAEAWCQKALALRPGYPEALNNLGTVFKRRGRLDEAEGCYRRALSFDPGYAAAHSNLGTIASDRGNLDKAEACFRRALSLDPDSALIKYNLSTLSLLRGNYGEGLALYENRFDCFTRDFRASRGPYANLKQDPRWRGEALSGKRIFVWTEQGIGDSLMVMRYLPKLRERGARQVIVYCEASLARLMQAMPGVDRVVLETEAIPVGQFDLHCPIMSLPYAFDSRQDSVPNKVPYLSIPERLRMQWRERLSGISKFRVGLVWAGNRTLRDDARRSIHARQFAPLLGIEGVQLISLQKGEAAAQLQDLPSEIPDWMDACEDFMDTAALVENLDLVISVDTAVAHLAGALGKPVWLLNRFGSEWRWGLAREDSSWYPTMKIFRQSECDAWDSVFERICAELEESASLASTSSGHVT